MKELIEYIAKALVDNADAVQVSVLEKEHGQVYELKVAKEDLGKVIGKQGRMARVIRTVLAAAASRSKIRAQLEIVE
jgi:predicted RNA-binding protein YlqC (UPF0109 family)